jgi:O-antigen ligase
VVCGGLRDAAGKYLVVVLLGSAVVVALRARPRPDVGGSWVPLACAALAIWSVARAALASTPLAAISVVALLAGIAGVLFICRRTDRSERELLAASAIGIGALVAASGWAGVAWRVTPWALSSQGLWRAASTLTYANAAAGLLAPLSIIAVSRLLDRPRSPHHAAAACLLLVGLGATLSRGGVLALLVGFMVLAGLAGVRRTVRATAPPVLGAGLALGALAPSLPAAAPARPLLAAAGLVAGLVVATGLSQLSSRVRLAGLLLATALLAVLVFHSAVAPSLHELASSRLTVSSPHRAEEARAALRLAGTDPLVGVGPGNALLSWISPDGRRLVARYAHNEYLQVLAEFGAIGISLLVALGVTFADGLRRGRATAPSPIVWAGTVAALIALTFHSAFDFLWHLPAIPLTAALLLGLVSPTRAKEG